MNRSAPLLGALLVFSVALPASAHNPEYAPNYSRPGLYLSGGGYFALVSSSGGFPGADNLGWNPDPSLDFRLGWRENERLALELDFGWIPSSDGIEYGNWLLGANAKFFFAEDRVQPYLIAGVGAMWARPPGALSSEVDWAFRQGIGVDYYIGHHWALSAETTFVWGIGEVWKNYFMALNFAAIYRF
jgi:opacity protein-like surface antigen